MGWRGTLRAMEAASRRAERESQRRYRQLQRDEKLRAKMEARQQAAYEVELFENQIERLISVHREAPEVWDWNGIYSVPPPVAPERSSVREAKAAAALNSFTPGFLDKLLGRADTKLQALTQAVEAARAEDEQQYQQIFHDYSERCTDWDERRQLAGRILQGDTQAYVDALVDFNPFADISELGASIDFKPHSAQLVELRLIANGERLIPDQIKSLTSTGKLSTKPMPKGQFHEIYLDFVCGVALRAGRELFAFLPVETVLVNVQANLLNTRTGQQALETILSVMMPRTVFSRLNFDHLDPSDAMENFRHRMEFRKATGFGPVEPLSEVETGGEEEPRPTSLPPPIRVRVEQLLAAHPAADGCHWITAMAATSLVGSSEETKVTLGTSRRIAAAFDEAGYCIEPDARFGSGFLGSDPKLGVFKPAAGETIAPSPAYHGAANLLRLCVLVAAADGTVDTHELGVFRQVIESQLHFSVTEMKRLVVLERLLAEDAACASKTLSKVAKAIPADKRMLVGQVLVKVAAVDHVITKSEYRALERVFNAFELPAQTLADLMLQVCPVPDEAAIQEAGEGTPGEPIPKRGAPEKPPGFTLDMSKVYAITNETKEVVGILSVVMEEEQDEAPPSPKNSSPPTPQTSRVTEAPPDEGTVLPARFGGLDPAFHPVLKRLLARDSWPRSEFHALAGEFHLMPLSIHDVINEWADESLGDFLLEGEDPILIRRELLEKS